MQRDAAYIRDILGAAAAAQEYLRDVSLGAFLAAREKQDAVVRNLEIIGEAVRRLSDETKASIPGVAWEQFRRLRNFLIHVYDNVDLKLVYDTVKGSLPQLERAIRAAVPQEDDS